ncbi:MAG: serine/threonine protein kinase [Chloroflexi bacterium]|nr:serine/threonine protein kinase [Chloroflexota bacterium]
MSDFAANFANVFYTTLLERHDLLAALRTARSLNMRGAWYSPVLYLRHQKMDKAGEPVRPTYHTRSIDTAVPAQAQAGVDFLVRLWIRKPETRPLTESELRVELDVPATVPVRTRQIETDIKFEPIETEPRPDRRLRRGEVEVKLSSPRCEVTPASIKLFVDEDLDAPPAIFTVRAREVGPASLFFTLWQDGGQIAAISHQIEAVDSQPQKSVETNSRLMPVQGETALVEIPLSPQQHLKNLIRNRTRHLQILKEKQALYGIDTPASILLQIQDIELELENLQAELVALSETVESQIESVPPPSPPAGDDVEVTQGPQAPMPTPPSASTDLTGLTIGPYQIKERIGQGGAGGVYKAYQPALGRYVTFRVLPEYYARDPALLTRFKQEAGLMAGLNHPSILPIYDFGQAGDLVYLVTKYVEAFSLRDAMRGEPLDLAQAVGVVEQVAHALAYMRRQGLALGDLKPDNVVVEQGQALLTDLGIFKRTAGSADMTNSGTIIGTPTYLAPEQVQGLPADSRSDVYILGVILYEMVTGQIPHQADSPLAILLKRINEPPLSPRSLNSSLPESVERVILKALATRAEDRYASPEDLAIALRHVVTEASFQPPTPKPAPLLPLPPPQPTIVPMPNKAIRWPGIALILLGVIIALLLLFLFYRFVL